jgi:adenine phosphoribosyltransferase
MAPDGAWLKDHIRDIPDFPTPGVAFKDLTPLFADVDAFRFTVDAIADHVAGRDIDKVVAIEARGFIIAAPVAYRLGAGLVPVRKSGKLPWHTEALEYQLEYGTAELEIHLDALEPGDQVLIVDDVLATGGTALAAIRLAEKLGAAVVGVGVVIELEFLHGREALDGYDVMSLVSFA